MCYSLLEKPNGFQYSFVTIPSVCFIIISATVIKLITSERKHKKNITFKNTPTSNCNKMLDPKKESLSTESMLEMDKFQAINHINIVPQIIYMVNLIII